MNLNHIIETKCLKYGGKLTLDEARYLAANVNENQAVPRVISKLLQSRISETEVLKVIQLANLITIENWTDSIDNKHKGAVFNLIVEKLPTLTESCFSSAIVNTNEEALEALIASKKNPFLREWIENKAHQMGYSDFIRKTYEKLNLKFSTPLPGLSNDIVRILCSHNLFLNQGFSIVPSFYKNAVLVCKLWNTIVKDLVTPFFKEKEIDLGSLLVKTDDQVSNFFTSFGTMLTELNVRDLENDPIVEKIPIFCPNLKLLKTRSDKLGTISQLTSLTYLSFYESIIQKPLEGLKHLTNLQTLDLMKCNELMSIGPEIQFLTNLEELDLSCTVGEERPLPDLTSLTKLKDLNLSRSTAYQEHPTFPEQLENLRKSHPSLRIDL